MEKTRLAMQDYWSEHSKQPTEQEMMLDSDAERIGKLEVPEILAMLPDLSKKDILELGAGIGRYTGLLAEKANNVIAVDFMENFTMKNKELNGGHTNIEFMTTDVMQLELPKESIDVVFSNWLLMYLDDEEVRALLMKVLLWLPEGGFLFFRESCFHQSGNVARSKNPTYYRNPATYSALLQSATIPTEKGKDTLGFDIVMSRSIQTYIKIKGNSNQVCWLLQKVKHQGTENHGYKTFQEFLDKQQYSKNSVLVYEKVFGKFYVSTGGQETTEEFLKMLHLKPGQQVLDVGCGIGGSAFLMAEKYKVGVTGIDLSSNIISLAYERAAEIKNPEVKMAVQFEIADATRRDYGPEAFDVIYSRDAILHIQDKKALFVSFLKWLKPGGKLLISDYCCSDGEHSEQFKTYVKQRGYFLYSPAQYGKILENVGFVNVSAEDRTNQFVEILKKELKNTISIKDEFVQEFSEADYEEIVHGWGNKLERCAVGDQRWGLFYAEKALH